MTGYVSRGVSPSQAAHIIAYMKDAGVPVRVTGGGSLMLGSPAHLAMLAELALEDRRRTDREH